MGSEREPGPAVGEGLPRRVLHPALAGLVHADKDVRQRAAVGLGQKPRPELADDVAELLWAETDFFVRETLTWVLTRTPEEATVAAVTALGREDAVRLQALHLLSKLRDPGSVHDVAMLIDDPVPVVADKARWALSRIGDPSVVPVMVERLGAHDASGRESLTSALAEFGAAAVPSLTTALRGSPDASVRAHAAEVLCYIGSPSAQPALEVLAQSLTDEDPDVRMSAVMAVRELITFPAARQALTVAARSSADSRIRTVAQQTLYAHPVPRNR